jgi:hypothetical protein
MFKYQELWNEWDFIKVATNSGWTGPELGHSLDRRGPCSVCKVYMYIIQNSMGVQRVSKYIQFLVTEVVTDISMITFLCLLHRGQLGKSVWSNCSSAHPCMFSQ